MLCLGGWTSMVSLAELLWPVLWSCSCSAQSLNCPLWGINVILRRGWAPSPASKGAAVGTALWSTGTTPCAAERHWHCCQYSSWLISLVHWRRNNFSVPASDAGAVSKSVSKSDLSRVWFPPWLHAKNISGLWLQNGVTCALPFPILQIFVLFIALTSSHSFYSEWHVPQVWKAPKGYNKQEILLLHIMFTPYLPYGESSVSIGNCLMLSLCLFFHCA